MERFISDYKCWFTSDIDGSFIAKLNLDDISSYGLETVTITLDSSLVQDGGVFDITENGIETVNEFYNEYVATGVR